MAARSARWAGRRCHGLVPTSGQSAPTGIAYFSDLIANVIYKLEGDTVSELIRSPAPRAGDDASPKPPRGGFFLQGLLVLLSNPKVLVFFGAFIPQFVDINSNHFAQVALLGATFMAAAAISDALYAILAGRARAFLSGPGAHVLAKISGGFMIGGGVWLALIRAR